MESPVPRPTVVASNDRRPVGEPQPNGETIPAPITPLLGRADDARAIWALVFRERAPLTTLVGPGGIGKTRLSLHIAERAREAFPDGSAVVGLAGIADPDQVASTVAAALAPETPASWAPIDRLRHALAGREMLVVLDNFEQILPAAPFVADLLEACPAVVVLATSRAPLRLTQERVYAVAPLALPDASQRSLRQIEPSAAVQLFVRRSQEVVPSFALDEENAADIAEICRTLDGLPLAIELAAARSAVLSPRRMLARLERRFTVLAHGPRDAPDRLRTMRSAIAWSTDLLSPGELALFLRLSVFAGGCSLAVAERLVDDLRRHDPAADLADRDALDLLGALVDHSLLQQEERAGDVRFRMLGSIRAYGLERLEERGDHTAAMAWLTAWCVAFVEETEPKLWGGEQREWIERLDAEYATIRAVLAWSIERDEVEAALRICGSLWLFWNIRGFVAEGQSWLERAFARDGAAGPVVRAKALNTLGNLNYLCGEEARARGFYERALAGYREAGDRSGVADTLNNLGLLSISRETAATARAFLGESLAIRRELDDPYGLAPTLVNLGDAAAAAGDYDEAEARHLEALAVARSIDNTRREAFILDGLAVIVSLRGDAARALALLAESQAAFEQIGERHALAAVLSHRGWVMAGQGRAADAATWYREALGRVRSADDPVAYQTIELVVEGLGRLAIEHGRARGGARLLGGIGRFHPMHGRSHPFVTASARDGERARAAARRALGPATYEAALTAGATLSRAEALDAARTMADRLAADPDLAGEAAGSASPAVSLTPRERQVLRLLVDGRTDHEIGDELAISPRTASNHVGNILAKLGVTSRTAAAAMAIRLGLT